jgi:hypothetical protein
MNRKLARYYCRKGLSDLASIAIPEWTQGAPGRTKQTWYQLNGEEWSIENV